MVFKIRQKANETALFAFPATLTPSENSTPPWGRQTPMRAYRKSAFLAGLVLFLTGHSPSLQLQGILACLKRESQGGGACAVVKVGTGQSFSSPFKQPGLP
jgi:hypothetical protein